MFIDIDLPALPSFLWLRRLFGRPVATAESMLEELAAALAKASDATFRIYRTAGGFRVLATDRRFDPATDEAERIMTSVGADPSFIQLCRAQKSFRARLTPKPWRCGVERVPGKYPRTPDEQEEFLQWLKVYERKAAEHSVCRYEREVGRGRTDPSIGPLLRVHDEATRVHAGLPLA
jgi:hypothetical protein